jgi:hypothetical protein
LKEEAMKSFRMSVLAIAACISMSACAALGVAASAVNVLGQISPSVKTTGDTVVIEGTRGLILANNAYQVAANGIAPFVAAKRFSPDQVDRIEKASNCANALLQGDDATAAASCGTQVGSALTAADRAAKVFAIADEFSRLTGK